VENSDGVKLLSFKDFFISALSDAPDKIAQELVLFCRYRFNKNIRACLKFSEISSLIPMPEANHVA
jgi:hypothetical protein